MLTVLSSCLVATAAFIPGAQAGLSASSSSGSTREGSYSYSTKSPPTKKHYVKESSVKCKATATAISYADAASDFADAVADAVVYGCSLKLDDEWSVMVDKMKDHAEAWAFAKAAAHVDTECKSTGNAYGCAVANAHASAWAEATIKVWASAWAYALNHCKCNKKDKNSGTAEAFSFGNAYEFHRLVAEVEAEASAYVCVEGDDHQYASADAVCVQDIYATGFAKAFAKALIEGECYDYYGGGLDAEAKTAAIAKIEVWEYVDC